MMSYLRTLTPLLPFGSWLLSYLLWGLIISKNVSLLNTRLVQVKLLDFFLGNNWLSKVLLSLVWIYFLNSPDSGPKLAITENRQLSLLWWTRMMLTVDSKVLKSVFFFLIKILWVWGVAVSLISIYWWFWISSVLLLWSWGQNLMRKTILSLRCWICWSLSSMGCSCLSFCKFLLNIFKLLKVALPLGMKLLQEPLHLRRIYIGVWLARVRWPSVDWSLALVWRSSLRLVIGLISLSSIAAFLVWLLRSLDWIILVLALERALALINLACLDFRVCKPMNLLWFVFRHSLRIKASRNIFVISMKIRLWYGCS